MKDAPKKKVASPVAHSSEPFFNKTEEGGFFSKAQETETSSVANPVIQAKLTVGQPNDKYEQEADAMADRVVRNSEPSATTNSKQAIPTKTGRPQIQRLSASKSPSPADATVVEKEKEAAPVQPLRINKNSGKKPLVSKKELDTNSGGKGLDANTQSFMESQFGNDFSDVKIHNDAKSQQMATSINARAFTYGNNIYFNQGEYQPASTEGKRTLAHELTHVVQQRGATNKKSSQPNIQKMAGLGRPVRTGVAPWSSPHPIGTNYEAYTNAGSKVGAWVAYSPYLNRLRYWCHGHSLGTYNNSVFGYSVYSGNDLKQVIKDEWRPIPPAQVKAGDIAVWTNNFDHSAKFVNPVLKNGQIDPAASSLSSKNGQAALGTMSLNAIIAIYGAAGIAAFRRK